MTGGLSAVFGENPIDAATTIDDKLARGMEKTEVTVQKIVAPQNERGEEADGYAICYEHFTGEL
jgi:hypothetical protein